MARARGTVDVEEYRRYLSAARDLAGAMRHAASRDHHDVDPREVDRFGRLADKVVADWDAVLEPLRCGANDDVSFRLAMMASDLRPLADEGPDWSHLDPEFGQAYQAFFEGYVDWNAATYTGDDIDAEARINAFLPSLAPEFAPIGPPP